MHRTCDKHVLLDISFNTLFPRVGYSPPISVEFKKQCYTTIHYSLLKTMDNDLLDRKNIRDTMQQ